MSMMVNLHYCYNCLSNIEFDGKYTMLFTFNYQLFYYVGKYPSYCHHPHNICRSYVFSIKDYINKPTVGFS